MTSTSTTQQAVRLHEPPPASLAEALARLQTSLPTITKNAEGQVGGNRKNKYADLAQISKDLLPRLGELGLSFSAKPTWVTREDGSRDFVLAYTLRHVSGESDSGEYPLARDPSNHQMLGSAITYGRRYCLCAVTGAVAEDDDDGQLASAPASRSRREPAPIRPFDELPRNVDGSLSRSRCTEAELEHYGAMTSAQQKAHNKLERDVLGTDSDGKVKNPVGERLPGVPPDDEFYFPPLRAPHAAPDKAQSIVIRFSRLGITDRDQRLKATSTIVGREIKSTNDLTAAEGIAVTDFLAPVRTRSGLIERLAEKAGEDSA